MSMCCFHTQVTNGGLPSTHRLSRSGQMRKLRNQNASKWEERGVPNDPGGARSSGSPAKKNPPWRNLCYGVDLIRGCRVNLTVITVFGRRGVLKWGKLVLWTVRHVPNCFSQQHFSPELQIVLAFGSQMFFQHWKNKKTGHNYKSKVMGWWLVPGKRCIFKFFTPKVKLKRSEYHFLS